MATQTANPTSDISATGTWGGTAGSRYTLVDDYPSTVITDQLTHGTTAGAILFGYSAFSVPSGSTINFVRVQYYDRDTAFSAQANNASARIRVGGTTYDVATHAPTITTTLRQDTWNTNPRTSSAWTVDDVNGVGSNALDAFGIRSTDADPVFAITSIQLVVDYTESTGFKRSFGVIIG